MKANWSWCCPSAGSEVRLWCGSHSAVCLIPGDQTLYHTPLDNNTHSTGTHTHTHTPLFIPGGSLFVCKRPVSISCFENRKTQNNFLEHLTLLYLFIFFLPRSIKQNRVSENLKFQSGSVKVTMIHLLCLRNELTKDELTRIKKLFSFFFIANCKPCSHKVWIKLLKVCKKSKCGSGAFS